MSKPIIGVMPLWDDEKNSMWMHPGYFEGISQAGGVPIMLPLSVDKDGLDQVDIEYLKALIKKFNGGPVGVETIATSIGEEVTTIEDVVEPFLLQEGYVKRTQRGRIATDKAYDHLEISHYPNALF